MRAKQIVLAVVLLDFLGLTAYALHQYGVVGFFELALANAAVVTLFADLIIALALISMWMWRDAQQRGISVAPYLVLTLALGSVGPLAYLLRIGLRKPAPVGGIAGAHAAGAR
jgi:hypothetical protein